MEVVILVLHILLALSLIGIILLQPPENSSLGGLGGSNAMSGFSARGQGNILTRATAIIAGLFIVTSLTLAIISGVRPHAASILDQTPVTSDMKTDPAMNAPKVPGDNNTAPAASVPETPAVPLAK